MAGITAFLLIGIAMVLQNSIVTRLQMLQGAADLVLLVLVSWVLLADEKRHWHWGLLAGWLVGISSAVPFWVPIIGYVSFVLIISWVQRQVWQVPIWLLVTSTFFGTIFILGLEIMYMWFTAVPYDLLEMLNIVVLPSLVLNMIMILPVYALVGELTKRLFPKEVDL
jgi:hypothetical protein